MEKICYSDYENLIGKLRNVINDYYGKHSNNKVFQLYLASGEQLIYIIPEFSIAHLLGIDTEYLYYKSCFSTESKSAIEILNKLCSEENVYSTYNKINCGHLSFNSIFSSYFEEKLNAFENNIQPNAFQMEFVCKIDRNICYNNGHDPINCDYILCSKDENDNYLVLGISKNANKYVATTNQLFTSLEDLKNSLGDTLKNQEITFISRIFISSNDYSEFKVNATLNPLEKSNKVALLEKYSREFDSKINICYDYQIVAKQNYQNYNNINFIIENMEKQQTITSEMQSYLPYLGNNLKKVIDAYNNVLNNSSEKNGSTDYSVLAKENETLKTELLSLREQIVSLQEKERSLTDENSKLTEESQAYRSVLDKTSAEFQKLYTKYPR